MSIADYHAQFIQLARFAPQSEVPEKASKTWKFQRGLKPEYKLFMASHKRLIVEEAYKAALRLEREATNSWRHSDYQARCDADDRPKKRHQYLQHAVAMLPLFVDLPELIYLAPPVLAPLLPTPPQQSRGDV